MMTLMMMMMMTMMVMMTGEDTKATHKSVMNDDDLNEGKLGGNQDSMSRGGCE